MSVIIFTEHSEGKFRKSSLEAVSYGVSLAEKMNTEPLALVIGDSGTVLEELGQYGVKKVLYAAAAGLAMADTKSVAQLISNVATENQAQVLVFSNTLTAKGVAPRVAVRLGAGLVSGAISLPVLDKGFTVRKTVFSGKAFSDVNILSDLKVITLNPNAFDINKGSGTAEVIKVNATVSVSGLKVRQVNKSAGDIPLPEAERVISGGRGLKGPENWGMVEELASLLGAATACSRAVADAHWRPHHEHVGQTGLAISPNLYFAIGISGAIQHLAGVNRSKTIVVVNKDPEAPFFKAADYGIVGDAFEVMPKIIQAVKELG